MTYLKAFREVADLLRTIVDALEPERDYTRNALHQGIGAVEALVSLLEEEDN